jgi:hypothetical protein
MVGHLAGEPQIIFLTEDEDVASWARLESLTGELSVIEPVPAHDGPAPDPITSITL